MLEAVPLHWLCWDFNVVDGQNTIARIDVSWWREKGVLTIDNKDHQVYRERLLGGAFVLEDGGEVLARAVKPSLLSRRLVVEHDGQEYALSPQHFVFRRSFILTDDSGVVGTLSPRGLLTRRMRVDLPERLALPVRIFIVWLTVILWKRDSDASG